MEHFRALEGQIKNRLFFSTFCSCLIAVGVFYLMTLLELDSTMALLVAALVSILISYLVMSNLAPRILDPIKTISRAVLHISNINHTTPAPDLDKLQLGRELVSQLVLHIYQFASQENSKDLVAHRNSIIQATNVVNHLPLPLFVFNKELLVTNTSNVALEYCQLDSSKLLGRSIFDVLHLEFPSEDTLDTWIKACQKNKVTDTAHWDRVRVLSLETNEVIKQCDITAYYNKDNPSGTEFIVTLFDRTELYGHDDDGLSFVALAVHELRTPLTMLRGYIEVFEEELEGKLDTELAAYMLKMQTSAKRLSDFVTNILNVVRVDQNQLTLHLSEANWNDTLKAVTADMEQRAQLEGMTIEYELAPKLPTVAVDQVSVSEVLINIMENAIKYGGQGKRIIVSTGLDKQGLVETTIQDFGVGIPANVLPTLFEKFTRSHRTREQVGGTGLGLYLTKALVTAHGGQVWVKSEPGKGSTFGFSLQPYANLKDELKDSASTEITRSAHGWIKNHSLYKR